MTSDGFPYGRLRRALDRGNLLEAKSAAAELGELPLSDTLELLLLIAAQEPATYQWAAVRWHGRYCRERRVRGDEAQGGARAAAYAHGFASGAGGSGVDVASDPLRLPAPVLMQFTG